MTKSYKVALTALRVSIGWLFLYAGITKIVDPTWSAAGYLQNAKSLPGLFAWFASPAILPVTNFLNEWGLTLIGLALILGFATRLASALGMLLMALYYLPVLDFPYPNAHAFIVDEHIIYIFALAVLASLRAGRIWGLDKFLKQGSALG